MGEGGRVGGRGLGIRSFESACVQCAWGITRYMTLPEVLKEERRCIRLIRYREYDTALMRKKIYSSMSLLREDRERMC